MSKYTKGPWVTIENATNISIATGPYKSGGHQVAFVSGAPHLPYRRANARLMAASPEMADMLHAIIFEGINDGGPTQEEISNLLKKAGVL